MADVRPFRGLRYTARVDAALAIAPPYDVISPEEQRALYERSPHNVVRIEYGIEREGDDASDSRYTRAAADLARWRSEGVLALDDAPAIYPYYQDFGRGLERYERTAVFVAVRLEPWEAGVVLPHERTLAAPKADRLELLRTTRTQISPVYGLVRGGLSDIMPREQDALFDVYADEQHHILFAISDEAQIDAVARGLRDQVIYIADGHHRYETALAYRDEMRARSTSWSDDESENFVLMALTQSDDPGLLVLPTHRVVHRPITGALDRLERHFSIEAVAIDGAMTRLSAAREPSFVALGLALDSVHVLTLRDRSGVEALMPADQPDAWRRLDVNVLQYGVLLDLFGIDDAALIAGGAVSYTQDAMEAQRRVTSGEAVCAFLVNATPVEQVLAVADAAARMPQKSTYFYPKLPTGLVMRALDEP